MTFHVGRHLELYRDPRFFSAFPSVVQLGCGDFLVGFRRAPDSRWLLGDPARAAGPDFDSVDHVHPRSHVALLRLGSDLAPQGGVVSLPTHPEAGDQDANFLLLRSGRLLQYGFLWYPVPATDVDMVRAAGINLDRWPFIPWGGYSRVSDDEGRTWTEHRDLPAIAGVADVVPGVRAVHGGALRGRGVELDDGTILIPSYGHIDPTCPQSASRLWRSTDGGDSFADAGVIAADPDFGHQEPALAPWPAGRLTAFHRTFGAEDRIAITSRPLAGGAWAAPQLLDCRGHPQDPLVLRDGSLLLVYGYRHELMGLRARWLAAGETDIDAAPEIVIREDGLSSDLGYPSAVELADGRVLVVYYFCGSDGTRHIAASLLGRT